MPGQEVRAAAGLHEHDLASDPITQFLGWYEDAKRGGVPFPDAVMLGTADGGGRPSVRTVILREVDERGFAFFTNYGSRKGQDLADNPHAALGFSWHEVRRQVTVTGSAVRLTDEESDRYFATRPRGSQLAAWASQQSTLLPDRPTLDAQYAEIAARYEDEPVPRPPWWGGFRVVPATVEFWQHQENRLHDRLRFRRTAGSWLVERLAP
jgi:pyridoxamine 5'-phosphate oxidase